ncbi:MAG: hypothetical protein J7L98_01710 [Candidatus Verstraetearchaeota archaeon]|nr:hypothetical protein [Candidatus Verstraetearchaeota archaeon]
MPICPECGGEMKFDRSRYMYVCTSCGLAVTRSELDDLKKGRSPDLGEDERERWRREYLKWWLSSKR